MILAVGIPSVVGLTLLAPNLAATVMGSEFREEAAFIVPWIALAAFLLYLREFHFNRAFHLSRRTMGLLVPYLLGAVTNLTLNLLLIPRWGVRGALWAAVATQALALAVTCVIGQRRFPLPFPWLDLAKVLLAVSGMALCMTPVLSLRGPLALAGQIGAGVSVYALLALGLDLGGARGQAQRVARRLGRRH
jgi:O-antigen/teichoic acid export membrane protein